MSPRISFSGFNSSSNSNYYYFINFSLHRFSKALLRFSLFSYSSLILGVDDDRLALGVIETVHRFDVQHPRDADGHDGQQQEGHKQSSPDSGARESHAVPGLGEGHLGRGHTVQVDLQLQTLDGQHGGGLVRG